MHTGNGFLCGRVTMIVCVCHRISDREISRHAHTGMSFDEIQLELGVATQCGNCEGCARSLVQQCHVMGQIAALHREGVPVGQVSVSAASLMPAA